MRLLRNKKGLVFADVVGAIQRSISWFLTSAPGPLKLLIFLLLIVVFAQIFGFMINATGNFCDTQGNKYTTGVFDIGANAVLLFEMPNNDDLNSDLLAVEFAGISPCSQYFEEPFYYESGQRVNLTPGWYYQGATCSNCQSENIYDFESARVFSQGGTHCISDVYRLEPEEKSLFQKLYCDTFTACVVPQGYFYNQTVNKYQCSSENTCNTTTQGEKWNQLLLDKGASIEITSDIPQQDYRQAVSISCEAGNVQPQFKVFGVKILDFRLWVLLTVLSLLIYAVYKIKHP